MNDGGILSGDVGRDNADDDFDKAKAVYERCLRRCHAESVECHGKMFRPKTTEDNPFRNYIPMSFSLTLIHSVGGMRSLRKWWEPE